MIALFSTIAIYLAFSIAAILFIMMVVEIMKMICGNTYATYLFVVS